MYVVDDIPHKWKPPSASSKHCTLPKNSGLQTRRGWACMVFTNAILPAVLYLYFLSRYNIAADQAWWKDPTFQATAPVWAEWILPVTISFSENSRRTSKKSNNLEGSKSRHPIVAGEGSINGRTVVILPPQPLPAEIRLLRIPKAGSSSFSAFLRLQYQCTIPFTDHPPGDCTKKNSVSCPALRGCYGHGRPPRDLPRDRPRSISRFYATEDEIMSRYRELIHRNQTDLVVSNDDIRRRNAMDDFDDKKYAKWLSKLANQTRSPVLVTMIRNPVDRYISAYYYPGHHGRGTENISDHVRLFPEWNNIITNFLAGRTVGTWRKYSSNKKRLESPPPEAIPHWHPSERAARLTDALNLVFNRIAYIGIVEYWNDSLKLFCRMFRCATNVTTALTTPKQRDNQKRKPNPEFDWKTRQILIDANDLDQVVYQASLSVFCHRMNYYANGDPSWAVSLSPAVRRMCSTRTRRR
jgi:Sulfotransferase family